MFRERALDILGVDGLALRHGEADGLGAVGVADVRPAIAERSHRAEERLLAGTEEVDDGGLEAAGATCRIEQDVVVGAERPAQTTDDIVHHRGELRAAVVDHGTARGTDHASGERGRTGNAELWFTHGPKSSEGRVRHRPPPAQWCQPLATGGAGALFLGHVAAYSSPMEQTDLGQNQRARVSGVDGSRRAWITALAVAIAFLAVVAAVLAVVLVVANRAHLHAVADFDLEDIIVPISFGALGALVASRQPRNVIGWLLLSIAVISALQGLSDQYARYGFVTHPGAPAAVWALWLDSWVISFVFPCGALALLLLLFPDGRLPSRKWRPLVWIAVIFSVLIAGSGSVASGQLQTETTFAKAVNPIGLPAKSTRVDLRCRRNRLDPGLRGARRRCSRAIRAFPQIAGR